MDLFDLRLVIRYLQPLHWSTEKYYFSSAEIRMLTSNWKDYDCKDLQNVRELEKVLGPIEQISEHFSV